MTLNTGDGEQGTGGAGVPTKQWTHVTVSILYQTATIFFNGTLVGYASGVWLTPFQTCNTTDNPAQNAIGLSQFSGSVLRPGSDQTRSGSCEERRTRSGKVRFGSVEFDPGPDL